MHLLDEDPELKDDIYRDMAESAAMYGEVKNVTVFDLERAGLVTVRFSNNAGASEFAAAMDGRLYDGRTVTTELISGKTKYKKTRKTDEEKAEEENKRIEEYSNYIEGDEEK